MRYRVAIIISVLLVLVFPSVGSSFVVREGEAVYIVDRMGEKWDVTQAATLGFNPEKFQYGIGKTAFTPLGEDDMSEALEEDIIPSDIRIIGVHIGDESHAYAVGRLSQHEIANTEVGEKPVAVGY